MVEVRRTSCVPVLCVTPGSRSQCDRNVDVVDVVTEKYGAQAGVDIGHLVGQALVVSPDHCCCNTQMEGDYQIVGDY